MCVSSRVYKLKNCSNYCHFATGGSQHQIGFGLGFAVSLVDCWPTRRLSIDLSLGYVLALVILSPLSLSLFRFLRDYVQFVVCFHQLVPQHLFIDD